MGGSTRYTVLSPILIYRLSTVYVPCINRISTVADGGRIAFNPCCSVAPVGGRF